MPSFKCRRWRDPSSTKTISGEDVEDWNAPDQYVHKYICPEPGDVIFVEVQPVRAAGARPDESWVLWRLQGIHNPLGEEFATGLFTAQCSEKEATAELVAMGVAVPREPHPS
jgi:hypothetical protein